MRSIDDAVLMLRQGEVVGVPTDTVYGLAADPRLPASVHRLFDLKGRPPDRPIGLLVTSFEQATMLAVPTAEARRAAEEHWPGALTIVLAWRHSMPPEIGDHFRQTVGLRVPNHPVVLELLDAVGALAVTSANRSGQPPAMDHFDAEAIFGAEVAGYLDGTAGRGAASTVVDFTVEPPRVVREGPIDWV